MRPIVFAAAFGFCCAAWAGQPAASAPATGTVVAAAAAPAADKVYPPLPSLAMLPPAAGDDDELPAPHSTSHRKKVCQRDCHCAMPTPRLVVSDASRAYLKDIEQQLDSALAQ
ncbi:hypothetical protein [Paraburkholderia silvatlantica]|uniref:Uncharacterized protein n=1 Tax=Paraburkholderia silvatlantica TaxID=321895 RepID=A0ABR6FHA4_9BURK|nr:hypothetical protein [Paraburkholderia silvatlantica]MBB2926190.1 hypothetical protein [Paraburkholderia silvatlantica]PVY26744.1 hypothetical protein C7411_12218 [Paraburkholderia silvatlantica]PXW33031.1 hypothetical protein C7413_12118 [Paraburkholderia silvatlantica]